MDIRYFSRKTATYDHRLRSTGHPVRSAIHKPQIGRLVVGWVTTSEYLLSYVFCPVFLALSFSHSRDPVVSDFPAILYKTLFFVLFFRVCTLLITTSLITGTNM